MFNFPQFSALRNAFTWVSPTGVSYLLYDAFTTDAPVNLYSNATPTVPNPTLGSELNSGSTVVGNWYSITASQTNYFYTGSAIGQTFRALNVKTLDANNKVKLETLSTLLSNVVTESTINKIPRANITLTSGTQCGLVINLDSNTSPANFVIAYHDGTNCHLDKCVAGTYTSLINTAATYSAGAIIKVAKNGNVYKLIYNGAQVGTDQTISDVGIISNSLHGLFSTYASNSFSNFMITSNLDGTVSESPYPTGGGVTRTVVDTNGKLSLSGGVTNFADGINAWGNPSLWYPSQNRIAGKILTASVNMASSGSGNGFMFGFDSSAGGSISGHAFYSFNGTVVDAYENGSIDVGVSAMSASTNYYLLIIQRATGAYYYIKGGTHTYWDLVWIGSVNSATPLFPTITEYAKGFVFDNIRIPVNLWLPSPIVSDGFSDASVSDGLGHAEGVAGGLGSGGGGLARTNAVGTWTVASGKAQASALSSGIAIETYPTTATVNILHEAALTRSAGDVGIVVRYVDSSNYVRLIHNGTNVQLVKVVGGTPTTLINTAATYGAGNVIRCICYDTKFRAYYNNAFIGSEQTISDAALQAGSVGLYTSDTGNTIDNAVMFARGTNNEYSALDAY